MRWAGNVAMLAFAAATIGCDAFVRESALRPGAEEEALVCGPDSARIWKLTPDQLTATMRAIAPSARDIGAGLAATLPPHRRYSNEADVLDMSEPHVRALYDAVRTEVSRLVREHPAELAPCLAGPADDTCASELITSLGSRAFRRPLNDEEIARYTTLFTESRAQHGVDGAVEIVIRALVTSPHALFRWEIGTASDGVRVLEGYEIASAIAYFLSDGPPDAALLAAAANGELADPDARAAHAERILSRREHAEGLLAFLREHFAIGRATAVRKSAIAYPEFDEVLAAETIEESERFLADVLWAGDGTLATLLTASHAFVTPELAAIYGVEVPTGSPRWTRVELAPEQRAGILTRLAYLAGHAREDETDLVGRGIFVRERMLCLPTPPPPPTVNAIPIPRDGVFTHRQRLEQHRADPSCARCHALLDPLGYPFESFDAIGRFRTTDSGLPVDPSSTIVGTPRTDGEVADAIAFSEHLASSPDVEDCFALSMFRYAYGRRETERDRCELTQLQTSFRDSGGDVRALAIAIVRSPHFVTRSALR